MKKLLPIVFAALIPAIAAADDDCRYSADRLAEASTDGITEIVVRAGAGSLTINGEAGRRALRAVGQACAEAQDQLDSLQIRLERSGNRLTLVTDIPESKLNPMRWFRSHRSARIHLNIDVPSNIALDVEDGSGEATITNVAALRVRDGSGSLRIANVKGNLDVEDGSGEIEIREVEGSIRMSDGSGEISIAGVRGDVVVVNDGSGGIIIEDVQGNVTIGEDGSGEIRIERVTGSVRIENDGSGGIRIATVGHDVSIERDGSGDIVVEDVEGDFTVFDPGSGSVRHDRVRGSVQIGGRGRDASPPDAPRADDLQPERQD